MENILYRIYQILITLPAVLISLSVHELCHGFAAYKLGDPTAKYMGRLSLNPLRHIDPIGFFSLLLFRVGWAKPVNIDTRYFKNPKRDLAICAFAGPLSNFLMAFLFSFVTVFTWKIGVSFGFYRSEVFYVVYQIIGAMVTLNLGLGVFNLVPIPPLDGSKILYAFLPAHVVWKIVPYEKYIQLALFVLLWLGVLSGPIQSAVSFLSNLFLTLAEGVIL